MFLEVCDDLHSKTPRGLDILLCERVFGVGPSPSPESLLAHILWASPVAKAAVVETQGGDLESLP